MQVLVNSVNVRRFLSSMIGIRRECLESTGSLKVKPRQRRPVARTHCAFVEVPYDDDPAFEPVSRSCVHEGGPGT